jgi:pilus assembly protein CpaB
MIIISLLLGLAAVAVAGKWVIDRTSVDASAVIIASQDIDVGTRLTPDLLQSTDWPRANMPPDLSGCKDARFPCGQG